MEMEQKPLVRQAICCCSESTRAAAEEGLVVDGLQISTAMGKKIS